MTRTHLFALTSLIFIGSAPVQAGTIIKLGFSTDSVADIELKDNILSTVADASGATMGDQNTELSFLGLLAGQPAIEGATASFSLDGIQLSDMPQTFGSTVIQTTEGGTFSLYNPSNVLLLAGSLGDGTLSGPLGGTATGGFLTTEFGDLTGGSLLPLLQSGSNLRSTFSLSLTDVNAGQGFTKKDDGELADFTADGTANIGVQTVPEPTSHALLFGACLGVLGLLKRR